MQIGDLVRHWDFSENHLGIVVGWEKIVDTTNFKVQWADGTTLIEFENELEVINESR